MKKIDVKLYKDNILEKEYLNLNSLSNKKLVFKADVLTEVDVTNNVLVFIRKNVDYEFKLVINNEGASSCTYHLLKENIIYDINVLSSSFKQSANSLEIKYRIETDEAEFSINIVKK